MLKCILYEYTVILFFRRMLVQDLFMETIALQRIALFTRLIAKSNCTGCEKDIALAWLSELTSDFEC